MTAERSLELSVPARVEYIAVVRLVVASLAIARRTLAEDRIDDLKLAVSEACTNAIEANLESGADNPVVVSCWEAPERFEVCVADAGVGFDPDDLPQHPPVTDPDRLNFERGLGIPLMRSLVDDVRFESSPGGTAVWMTLFGGPEFGDETTEILRVVISEQD
ncbi:MAG TPA: ATP-binding protein [Acidimicrobiales bacterium]|jgi:serine/threonine-protein kinase RsbW|nr:ATP-binding protein [Acidimicrobiales bacterium]